MEDLFTRVWHNLAGRVGGPLTFRLVVQPLVAVFLAIRAGLEDARERRAVYGWAVFTDPVYRLSLVRDGWKDIGKVFVAALIIDGIYEIIVLRWVYPGEALIVAVTLAVIPYLLVRGPTNRIARRFTAALEGS